MEIKSMLFPVMADEAILIDNMFSDFREFKYLMFLYQSALKTICAKLDVLNDEFLFIKNRNPIAHITSRIKSPDKIYEKLQRKGFEVSLESMRENLFDIAGARVICSFLEDIYQITEMIKSQKDIDVIKETDYIKAPKENGYRSFHMIVEVPVYLSDKTETVKVEVQIRTIAMDFWATLEHDLYYKRGKKAPKEIMDDLTNCAESISMIDKKMQLIKNHVEDLQ